jgi:Ca2+-binding RTX toxin-like protein
MDILEERMLLSRTAVLDFDGAAVTASEMCGGGWCDKSDMTFASFKNLFNSTRPNLDMNANSVVDATDANLAITRIAQTVKTMFAPYDLNIVTADWSVNKSRLTDGVVGDVMVFITGDMGFGGGGIAPWSDIGNENDEIVFAWGGTMYNSMDTADRFVNKMAVVAAQEMGHAFGLGHQFKITENPDAVRHNIMTYVYPDYSHYMNFQDLTYTTDIFEYANKMSTRHPEWNVAEQNQHQYLSHPDVLGPSPNPWYAVLQPGTLTVMGNALANSISVKTVLTASTLAVTGASAFVYRPSTISTSSPGLLSLNPFSTALTRIDVSAAGGNDRVTISTAVATSAAINGGDGNDTITGGAGDDIVNGHTGNDSIKGGAGNDLLIGLDGNDTIDGGIGDDNLYGSQGIDKLTGYSGNDYLDGGSEVDSLYGGYGHDELVGGDGNDYMKGDADNDTLDGGMGDDYLDGGYGNDDLWGNYGVDRLLGGYGNDYVDGGIDGQRDVVTGGTGCDRFVQRILALDPEPVYEEWITDLATDDTVIYK